MQGKKSFQPKLFTNFCLSDYIPDDNFYKILKRELDLSFVYKKTQFLYSNTGKPSTDPIVFFKCMLIGYLENVCSDRALERHINMRMDLRFFIDHDIDEPTLDHSTFCKTRKRISIEVFQDVFDHILKLCVDAGKRGYKKVEHTIYKPEYDEMIKKLKSKNGQESYALRMHTVEHVFGTLQQHYGLR